jgi:hypothetical protein
LLICAGILEKSLVARSRNRVGIGLPFRPARLHRLAESILGLLKSLKIPSLFSSRDEKADMDPENGIFKLLRSPGIDYPNLFSLSPNFLTFKELRNRFQGINSASLPM